MNSTSVSPTGRPNLCICGHPYIAHLFGAPPGQCNLCPPSSTGLVNQHAFTSERELNPFYFAASDRPGLIAAGGLGTRVSATSAASGQSVGLTTLTFQVASISPPGAILKPGMTVTTFPPQLGNSQTYLIIGVPTANQVLIPAPGLRFSTNGVPCIIQGALGSTMGPGRPPNGQRAG